MVQRTDYLEHLKAWKDEKVIKVITGIRRCGKSTLLRQYMDYLIETGVKEKQIIFLNFEELEYEDLLDYKALYQYLVSNLSPEGTTYIFLDEIQKVPEFERAVDSLYIKDNVDIYITGSNSFLLSGELATLLSGRYVKLSVLPFSFKEYYELNGDKSPDDAFMDYMSNGAFPYVALMDKTKEKIDAYLEGIYNTIIVKDIEERQSRRENNNSDKRKINDIALLKNIARFLAGSIGSLISVKSITDYIISSGRKISPNTVEGYLDVLEEAFVFYPVDRYDVLGKQLLKTNRKIYIVDLGLRRFMLSRRNYDLGFSLENVVYFELLRRGYTVNIGKAASSEVDFVARKNDRLKYYQVTASLMDENTFQREIAPLKSLNDNYPKAILTLDRFTAGDYDGIEVINIIDWLLNKTGADI